MVVSSTDGITWVARTPSVPAGLTAVAYGGGRFVAVGQYGAVLTSADAARWELRTEGIGPALFEVRHAAGRFADAADHWVVRQGYLQAALAVEAVGGFPDGTFRPGDPVTRAQVVQIAMAAIGQVPGSMPPYTDIRPDDWFAGWVTGALGVRLIATRAPYPIWTGREFQGNAPATRAEAAQVLANLMALQR